LTLRASLLRALENPNLSVDNRADLCCELAKELENKGKYEEARKALSAYWRRIGESPKLKGLQPSTRAEVLLRVGVLTGVIGSKNQIADAQETAKNLVSQSLTIFESQSYRKKIAEAQIEMALCYWRTGEINEARDLLETTLSRMRSDSELKAKAVSRLAIVELEAAHHHKALRILTDHAGLFQKINNQTLKGSYYVTLANVLEKLWEVEKRTDYLDRALVEYAAASYHFEQAEHRCYVANTENNLGLLYFTIKRYHDAQRHLDHARRVLASLKDIGGVAQVDETRACVLLAQGRIVEAEQVARSSVRSVEKSGKHGLLAESLITHGRALARFGNYGAALSTFRRAIASAEQTGSMNWAAQAALAAFHEIGDRLVVTEGQSVVSGRGLGEDKESIERDAIKLALEQAKGSVTHAARNLGISYQSLAYMLATRHRDLLKYRTPVRRRPRKQ
jgi:tetratricopeptide (TPR) repeat protein